LCIISRPSPKPALCAKIPSLEGLSNYLPTKYTYSTSMTMKKLYGHMNKVEKYGFDIMRQ
jgi:hypothetical protein